MVEFSGEEVIVLPLAYIASFFIYELSSLSFKDVRLKKKDKFCLYNFIKILLIFLIGFVSI